MDILPETEAAAIFTRLFEILARQSGKTLSERSRADIGRACSLLAAASSGLEELLDDLEAPEPARQPSQVGDERFQRWRVRRAAEIEEERVG